MQQVLDQCCPVAPAVMRELSSAPSAAAGLALRDAGRFKVRPLAAEEPGVGFI